MKCERRIVVSCILALCLSMAVGCGKKEQPQGTGGSQTQGTQAAPAPTTPAPAAPSSAAPSLSSQAQAADVDIQKPLAEVQKEADAMSVESLKATALKYKDAILSKQADVEKLVAKIKEIPVTEALGQEAKTLKTDLQNLQTTVGALKERYQVYYNKLKEKGADLTGLAF